jgi:hypothetical protein
VLRLCWYYTEGAPRNGVPEGSPKNGVPEGAPRNDVLERAPRNGVPERAPRNGMPEGAPRNLSLVLMLHIIDHSINNSPRRSIKQGGILAPKLQRVADEHCWPQRWLFRQAPRSILHTPITEAAYYHRPGFRVACGPKDTGSNAKATALQRREQGSKDSFYVLPCWCCFFMCVVAAFASTS